MGRRQTLGSVDTACLTEWGRKWKKTLNSLWHPNMYVHVCAHLRGNKQTHTCTSQHTQKKGEKTLDIGRFMWRLNHIVDVLLLICSLDVLNFKQCLLFLLYKHRSLQNLHTYPMQTLNLHMTLVTQVIVTIIVLICNLSSVFHIFICHWNSLLFLVEILWNKTKIMMVDYGDLANR